MNRFTLLFFILINSCNDTYSGKNKPIYQQEASIDEFLKLDDNAFVSKITDYLFKKSNYLEDFDKLNQFEKNILLVEYLEMEVNNGGFHQFYLNSSGNYSLETEQALKDIGAIKTLKILEAANDQFPNRYIPKDRELRFELVMKIEERAKPVWDSLNNKFYGKNPETDELEIDSTGVLIRKYVQNNLEEFK